MMEQEEGEGPELRAAGTTPEGVGFERLTWELEAPTS
jgi:hypothetical protein